MKRFFVIVWYFYIPFVALFLNFIVPYEVNKAKEAEQSVMDREYLLFLQQTLMAGKDEVDPYEEPSVQELVDMIDAIPLYDADWL